MQDTSYASIVSAGVVKVGAALNIDNGGYLNATRANASHLKAGNSENVLLTPAIQDTSTYYALSKLAGVDLANETVTVGTYPDTSKTAIRSMIGAVGFTDYASQNTAGVVKIYGGGLVMDNTGKLVINPATTTNCKDGSAYSSPITPNHQHDAVFYGLSKLAGEDLRNSDTPVGTYPQNAKTAIQTMLGIEADIPLIETVSGTTPSITGMPNVRYICGEVSSISITPPASGSMTVRFDSGSTATVLTVPNTVKFPAWFDATSLDINTTYEIMITDGVYGAVMSWA